MHSISAILQDLGWDTTGELASKDKRFEVHGANSAREFLKREAADEEWIPRRLQLVWTPSPCILLHPSLGIRNPRLSPQPMVLWPTSRDLTALLASF